MIDDFAFLYTGWIGALGAMLLIWIKASRLFMIST